jgi:preprotein translocase subunit Sss1
MKYEAILNLRKYKRQMKKEKKKPTKEQYENWFCKEIGLVN